MHLWHHALDREHRSCNFGNNLSIFDWVLDATYIPAESPAAFGIDDRPYPHDNIVRQSVRIPAIAVGPRLSAYDPPQIRATRSICSLVSSGYIGSDSTSVARRSATGNCPST